MAKAQPSHYARIQAWALSCPRLRYDQLTDKEKAARRTELAERFNVAYQDMERLAAPHIQAIRSYAANAAAGTTPLSLPPGMDADLRARLHEVAEELDLKHFSVGTKTDRRLVVFAVQ